MKCSTDKSRYVSRCFKIAVMGVLGIAAVTAVVMLLWNALLPELFSGVSRISYWQALGVLLLSRILFGGGLRGGFHSHWRARRAHWESMSPEERQQIKARFHGRWGSCCFGGKDEAAGDAGDTPAGRG